jgi:hypothetical protein
VNLREIDVVEPLNKWLGRLFARETLDRTVAQLLSSQAEDRPDSRAREAAKTRLTNATAALRRFQAAIAAGIDPTAIVDAVNEAQAQRAAAEAELETLPSASRIGRAEVYAMIDSLGDVGTQLKKGSPDKISQLYHDLGVELRFHPEERTVDVSASPRVVSECVRGGTRPLKLGIFPATPGHLPGATHRGTEKSLSFQGSLLCVLCRLGRQFGGRGLVSLAEGCFPGVGRSGAATVTQPAGVHEHLPRTRRGARDF